MLVKVSLDPYQHISLQSPSTAHPFGSPEPRANPGCLAVRAGGLAHREDERSQLHGFIHARGHATEGEGVHYERVPIRRKVNALNSVAYSIAASGRVSSSI